MADFIAEYDKVNGILEKGGATEEVRNAILSSYEKNEDGSYSVDLSKLTPD